MSTTEATAGIFRYCEPAGSKQGIEHVTARDSDGLHDRGPED
ncbi:MAG: hypothetical protein QM705_05760 [Ancrocorticia sp.]